MDFFEDDPSNARKVLDMLTVANEFCLFLEAAEKYRPDDIFDYLLKISPLLYLKGSLLPAIPRENDRIESRYVTEEQWETIFQILKQCFGKHDAYTAHFFNQEIDNETANLSLAENFADIYQDLKDFVMVYQQRTFTAKESAVYECNRLFVSHWGPRLLESLPQLHRLIYKEILMNDTNPFQDNDAI